MSEETFLIEPIITKDYILSVLSQNTIMEYYTGISLSKKNFTSPFREDKKGGCNYYINKSGILYFVDFAQRKQLDCFAVVMEKYGCTFNKALSIIANDFNLKSNPSINKVIHTQSSTTSIVYKPPSIIQVQVKDFTKEELEWWESYGITREILSMYNVYSCDTVFLNKKIFKINNKEFIFGYYYDKFKEVEYWRIYMPKNKSYRFLSNWKSTIVQGFRQLKYNKKTLIITKSMKDVMCLRSFNLEAIAPCSETIFIPEKLLFKLKTKYKNIILFYDNDLTGISFANKIRKKYDFLKVIFIPKDKKAKDISDYYKLYGRNSTLDLIKQGLQWMKG